MKSINNSFYLPEMYESDVISVITGLKNSSAGHDNIPASIAKEVINSLHNFRLN